MAKKRATGGKTSEPRKRRTKAYPSIPFDEALTLGKAILKFGGGMPVKRLTLMEKMDRSPTSGSTRAMITDSGKYGITEGSYNADTLHLTDRGRAVCSDSEPAKARLKAQFELAIENIGPFKALFDRLVGNRLPSKEVMRDYLIDSPKLGVPDEDQLECIDLFIVNCESLGLLRTIAGAQTLVPLANLLETLPATSPSTPQGSSTIVSDLGSTTPSSSKHDFAKCCLYISPIGSEGSDSRKHSDLFLGSLVRPAIEELGINVFRADEIEHAGMITGVVMEWIDKAKLVVADLSMLNPNVFYELALRHAKRKPLVCIIRKSDPMPFDVNQIGAVIIDNTDLHTFVPQIESFRSQIAAKARRAIEDPDAVGNPLFAFYPGFWDS